MEVQTPYGKGRTMDERQTLSILLMSETRHHNTGVKNVVRSNYRPEEHHCAVSLDTGMMIDDMASTENCLIVLVAELASKFKRDVNAPPDQARFEVAPQHFWDVFKEAEPLQEFTAPEDSMHVLNNEANADLDVRVVKASVDYAAAVEWARKVIEEKELFS